MDATEIANPVLFAQVIAEIYRDMDPAEFQKTVNRTISGCEEFIKADDTEFSASLDEAEATMYGNHFRSFFESLKELKKAPRIQSIQGPCLAKTVAFRKTLITFRTLHGK